MNKYSKPLVVFTAAAAISFLGFSAVSLVGGPNWTAEAELLPGYSIEPVEGEKVTWKVTDRVTNENVSVPKSEVQAAAVIAARNHLGAKLDKQTKANNDELQKIRARYEEAVKFRDADIAAMKKREAEMAAQLEADNKKILDNQAETVRKSQEAQSVRAEAEKRRGDVYRLKRELEEIRANIFQATEQQKKLRDHLIRLEGVIGPLERRQEQLNAK
jgi:hypothetical protein